MFYGEHLSAEEIPIQCRCGETATVEIFDVHGVSCGWFCRRHASRARSALRTRVAHNTTRKP